MRLTPGSATAAPEPPRWVLTPRRIGFAIICLIFLTSSFDVFLNFRIMGFSLRFCYLLILLLLAAKLVRMREYLLDRNAVVGFVPLAAWTLFLTAFVTNSPFLTRNVGYLAWHYIHILFIILLVGGFNRSDTYLKLFRFYVRSFSALAVFGLIQFAAGLAGFDLFIEQWWFPGVPRINGFSYEPSYFGTYLVIGWVMLFCLLVGRAPIFSGREALVQFLLVSACLVLSSSRMSILVAVVTSAAFMAAISLKALMTLRSRKAHLWLVASLVLLIAAGAGALYRNYDKVQFLFAGLALSSKLKFGSSSSHSVGTRFETMLDTFDVFRNSPIIGVSLGGVASTIAESKGQEVKSNDVARRFEGQNVFVEVLAASGIFGFAFFLKYLYDLFSKPLAAAFRLGSEAQGMRMMLLSMILGLALELIMLTMNQNILRPFLWVHIGMLSLGYKICAYRTDSAAA